MLSLTMCMAASLGPSLGVPTMETWMVVVLHNEAL